MCGVVVQPHAVGSVDESDRNGDPPDSETVPVDVADQVSVNDEFLEPTVHEVEVPVLIGRRSRMDYHTLSQLNDILSRS